MAYQTRMEPANVSGAGIIFGVFAALVMHILLNLLGLGLGLTAADTRTVADSSNAAAQAVGWAAFAWWTVSGVVSAFVGGAVAGWMAGAVDGSPGFHGLATWAVTTVIVIAGASILASTGSAIGAMAGPSFSGSARGGELSAAEIEAAADVAGTMALASFVALIVGAVASFAGARVAADREVRLHPHAQPRM